MVSIAVMSCDNHVMINYCIFMQQPDTKGRKSVSNHPEKFTVNKL